MAQAYLVWMGVIHAERFKVASDATQNNGNHSDTKEQLAQRKLPTVPIEVADQGRECGYHEHGGKPSLCDIAHLGCPESMAQWLQHRSYLFLWG